MAEYFNMVAPCQGIIQDQSKSKLMNISIGFIKSISIWLIATKKSCLSRSFTPSATGCSSPNKVTLLGPTRIWLRPSILRSTKVINATAPKANKKHKSTEKHQSKMCESVLHMRF
jgi:hypothetical protein